MKLKRVSIPSALFLAMLFGIFANLAHPITPAFLSDLEMPNYMFGVAFACMALSSFIFSKLWGRLCAKYGSVTPMVVGYFGYAFAQFLFLISTAQYHVMIARFVGGIFVSGIQIGQLVYIRNNSDISSSSGNLVKNTTVLTVFACVGYLAGGVLGRVSLPIVFWIQIIGLSCTGVLCFALLRDPVRSEVKKKESSMPKEKHHFGKVIVLLLLVSLFASIGTTTYEQSFNYYLRNQFNFAPTYNGVLKAITGVGSLAMNATVGMYILKKTDMKKSLMGIFLIGSVLITCLVLVDIQWLFLSINIVFSLFNILYQPILQTVTTDGSENQALIISSMQRMKSLGMIFGGLAGGFLYMLGAKVPFYLAVGCFLISAFFLWRARKGAN